MASAAQRRANRINAAKSTGPQSPLGKLRASRNAIQFGLFCKDVVLPGESPRQFLVIKAGLIDAHLPQNLAELMLVERMAITQWKLNRIQHAYAQLHEASLHAATQDLLAELEAREDYHLAKRASAHSDWTEEQLIQQIQKLNSGRERSLGGALLYVLKPEQTERLSRQEQRLENSLFRAARELERLQKSRKNRDGSESTSPYQFEIEAQKEKLDELEPVDDPNVQNEANLEGKEDKPQAGNGLEKPVQQPVAQEWPSTAPAAIQQLPNDPMEPPLEVEQWKKTGS